MTNPPIRVLVIDDEETFRNNLVRMLLSHGMSAEGVGDGAGALQALDASAYDVALLDLKMPGMAGEEVLAAIRQRGCPVEVVVLTGHAAMDAAIGLLKQGAYDYVLKPADFDELLDKVRKAFERRELNVKAAG